MGTIVAAATGYSYTLNVKLMSQSCPSILQGHNFKMVMVLQHCLALGSWVRFCTSRSLTNKVFGATPTESGLMLLPMVAGLMTASIGSGQIISRTGKVQNFHTDWYCTGNYHGSYVNHADSRKPVLPRSDYHGVPWLWARPCYAGDEPGSSKRVQTV